MSDLRLKVIRQSFKYKSQKSSVHFVVLDYSKSTVYPLNYVCVLPKAIRSKKEHRSGTTFAQLFGDRSVDVALCLMSEALRVEQDPEVISELQHRIKLIDTRRSCMVVCDQCGRSFEPVRRHKKNYCGFCLGDLDAKSGIVLDV